MAIQFKEKYLSEKVRLSKIVKEGISLFDKGSSNRTSGENIHKLEEIEFVLLDNLESMTTIKNEFYFARVSYARGGELAGNFLFNILGNLKRSKKAQTIDNLILEIDKLISSKKREKLKKYIVYIPLRIAIQLNSLEETSLKKLSKKSFGFGIVSKIPQKYSNKIKNSSLLSLFNNRSMILEFRGEARDLQFFLNETVNKNVDPFLGIISFVNHYKRFSSKWSSVFSEKAISEKPSENPSFFLAFEDNKLNHPFSKSGLININLAIDQSKAISMIMKTEWQIHNKSSRGNYKLIIILLKCFEKQNKTILEKSKDYFRIYYDGVTEGQIEMAFLKFWILSEKLFKGGNMVNDKKLVDLLKKLVGRKYTKERIENLHKKRNSIVHEMDCINVSESDRNLSKALSESLLISFIDPIYQFGTYDEFRFILENVFLAKDDKRKRSKIINKLIRA